MKLKDGRELTLRKAEKGDAANILAYLNQIGGESDNLLFGKDGMQMPVEAEEAYIESVNASETSVMLVGLRTRMTSNSPSSSTTRSVGRAFIPPTEMVLHTIP